MTSPDAPASPVRAIDHAWVAARTRRFGAWMVAERRLRAELPFVHTYLLTALGNPLVYLAAMGVGLAALVKGDVGGVSYLHFVAPALLVATVATTGAGWGTWPIMTGFKWERTYQAAASTALTPQQVAEGETLALVGRLAGQGAAFWLIGLPFGAWVSPGAAWTILWGTLAGLAFFTPVAAFAATLADEGLEFQLINRLIVMPMFLFAGTFFPLDAMPAYARVLGWLSPMWHGTQLARIASYGMANPPWLTALHAGVLLVLAAVGLVAMRRTFVARLTR